MSGSATVGGYVRGAGTMKRPCRTGQQDGGQTGRKRGRGRGDKVEKSTRKRSPQRGGGGDDEEGSRLKRQCQ